jgi:lipopolysaccharide transport system ATP-binding protein
MTERVIRVEGLSKRYKIGQLRQRHDTVRDAVMAAGARAWDTLRRLARSRRSHLTGDPDHIWAVRGVSFDIKQGEVVGLIGRNGAGKSTLLKILSRITEPTTGRARIVGRIASLLEVGTGFHPELTGRENVYLNGAILGMKKSEIERKLDEIVEFAEVSRFIDTPIKYYSSGMKVRLAFAVGAHLEPEILLVDEVLAVGDVRFQEKCLSRMRDVGQLGRTVVFVSHNMPAIPRLCGRAILIEDGAIALDGPSNQVVSAYLHGGRSTTAVREWTDPAKAPGRKVVRLRAARVRTEDGEIADVVNVQDVVRIEMEYDVLEAGYLLFPNFQFFNEEGLHLFGSCDLDPVWRQRRRPAGRYVSTVWVPGNLLKEGTIFVGVGCETGAPRLFQFWEPDTVAFRVVASRDGDSPWGDYPGEIEGVISPRLQWCTNFAPAPTGRSRDGESGDEVMSRHLGPS